MHIKKILTLFTILIISATFVFAGVHTSPSYRLEETKVVVSGGKANSGDYFLENVEIGKLFGGKSESVNYSLDTTPKDRIDRPNPPAINPVTSPTNNSVQALSGTKEALTSIYINGYEAVPLGSETTWSCSKLLAEGDNYFSITARNELGLESEPIEIAIILDTIPPLLIIDYPLDGTIATINPNLVEGTIDGVPFSEERTLSFGVNTIVKDATDNAGNYSVKSIEVYLVRQPIPPPQQ